MLIWSMALFGAAALTVVQATAPTDATGAALPTWAHLNKPLAQPLTWQASRAGQAPFVNTANVHLPADLLPAVLDALAQQPEGATQFLLASLRQDGDWAIIAYAPLDGPQASSVYIGAQGTGRLMIAQQVAGQWVAFAQGNTDDFAAQIAAAPDTFISPQAKGLLLNRHSMLANTVDYKWPWAIGLAWRWLQGWHYKSAHDIGTDGSDRRVLASADGVITYVCKGNVGAAVRIKHADGVETGYWHIDAGQLAAGIGVMQAVKQGQVLGILRPGTWTDSQGCQQYTAQSAESAHVHFEIPGDFTVDGWSIPANISTFTKGNQSKTCNGGCWSAANFFTSSNNPSGNPTPTPTITPSPTPTPTPLPVQLALLPSDIYTRPGLPLTLSVNISAAADITGVNFNLNITSNVLALIAITPTDKLTVGVIAQAQFSTTHYGVVGITFAFAEVTGTAGLTRAVQTTGARVYVGGCAGDLDLNSSLNLTDVQLLALHWPSSISNTLYIAEQDIDKDGHIDLSDLQRVAYRVGSTCAQPIGEPITTTAPLSNTPQVTLTFATPSQTIYAGGQFTVTVIISAVEPITTALDIGALALDLTRPMTGMQVISSTVSDDLGSSERLFVSLPMTTSVNGLTDTVGFISLNITPTITPTALLTQGMLAVLTLQAGEIGTHTLRLAEAQLTDARGYPISVYAVDEMLIEVDEGQQVWMPLLGR